MYVIDTNVVSELRKVTRGRCDPAVAGWAGTVDPSNFFVSAVTVMEIEIGVISLERRDPKGAASSRLWFEQAILAGFAGRMLDFDLLAARACAPLHVPNKRPERDAMIAASAIARGFTVVTRNVKDFTGAVRVLNPWSYRPSA